MNLERNIDIIGPNHIKFPRVALHREILYDSAKRSYDVHFHFFSKSLYVRMKVTGCL